MRPKGLSISVSLNNQMSYPEPIQFESQEALYKQAMFFYKEYERMKRKVEKLKESAVCHSEFEIDMYPVALLEDRYSGVYSGGAWVAVAAHTSHPDRLRQTIEGIYGEDLTAGAFGFKLRTLDWIAVGNTPREAVDNLTRKLRSRRKKNKKHDPVVRRRQKAVR